MNMRSKEEEGERVTPTDTSIVTVICIEICICENTDSIHRT